MCLIAGKFYTLTDAVTIPIGAMCTPVGKLCTFTDVMSIHIHRCVCG